MASDSPMQVIKEAARSRFERVVGVEDDEIMRPQLGESQSWFTIKHCCETVKPGFIPNLREVLSDSVGKQLAAAVVFLSLYDPTPVVLFKKGLVACSVICIRSLAEDCGSFFDVDLEGMLSVSPIGSSAHEAASLLSGMPVNGTMEFARTHLETVKARLLQSVGSSSPESVLAHLAALLGLPDSHKVIGFLRDLTASDEHIQFITFSSQYLRFLLKAHASVMRGVIRNADKTPGWAGYSGKTDLLVVPEKCSGLWAQAGHEVLGPVASHMLAANLFDREKYRVQKRWFALRAEWFGLGMLTVATAIGEAYGDLRAVFRGLSADWNVTNAGNVYLSYAAYACHGINVRSRIGLVSPGTNLTTEDCIAGKFARCFSTQYLGWCSIRTNQRFSALCLGFLSYVEAREFALPERYQKDFYAGSLVAKKMTVASSEYFGETSTELRAAYAEASEKYAGSSGAKLPEYEGPVASGSQPQVTEQQSSVVSQPPSTSANPFAGLERP